MSDFYLTSDLSSAPEPTRAWVCYDREFIYAAFECKESQPDRIVTQQKKRGGSLRSDDWVGIQLACYPDRQPIVWFDVSAGGVQVEDLQSGDVSKIEWKGDWQAAARIIDHGYAVEMAIPFSILQYDPSQTEMSIAFLRQHARTDHTWWAPNVGPTGSSNPLYYYLWKGLSLPKPAVKPMMMGYSLLGIGDGDSPTRLGFDAKHALTPTVTGAFTLNPDFRNVEQDVDSVDFTYTERWLPDSRPFFQEGSSYFPGSDIFYTRRIGDIDMGGKVYGKYGDYSLAALHARKFGRDDYSVVSVVREWPNRAMLYLRDVLCNTAEYGSDNATSLSGGYTLYDRRGQKVDFSGGLLMTGLASDSGKSKSYEFRLGSYGRPRTLEWSIGREVVDPDFAPYLGYVPEADLDIWRLGLEFRDVPSRGAINHWYTDLSASLADHTDGSLFYNAVVLSGHIHWQDQTAAYLDLISSHRPPYRDQVARMRYRWASRDLYRGTDIEVGLGRRAGGSYLYYGLERGWLLTDRLSLQTAYEYSRIKYPSPEAYSSGQFIGTLSYDIDTERTLAGRLISRDEGTNFYLAYKQRVRAGMDVYVIFGDPNAETTKTSVLVKLIRPF